MKVLKICSCKDGMLWYGYSIGSIVPYIGEENDYYWSREPDGYKNIVYKCDAIIIEQQDKQDN